MTIDADARTLPGERVAHYDLLGRRDTDYYAVFADIPDADRAVWDRARGVRRRGRHPHAGRVGCRDLPCRTRSAHGRARAVHRRHRASRPAPHLPAGRGPGEHGDLAPRRIARDRPRRAGRARAAHPRVLRLPRAAAALAPPARRRHRARRLRVDGARPRLRLRLARDHRHPHRRRWSLSGTKKWIGNGASGGITFVWAVSTTRAATTTATCGASSSSRTPRATSAPSSPERCRCAASIRPTSPWTTCV